MKVLLVIIVVVVVLGIAFMMTANSIVEGNGKELITEAAVRHLVDGPDLTFCEQYSQNRTFEGIDIEKYFKDRILKYGPYEYDVTICQADEFGYRLEFRLRTPWRWAVFSSTETFAIGRIHANPDVDRTEEPYPGRLVFKKTHSVGWLLT